MKVKKSEVDPKYCSPNPKTSCCAWNEKNKYCMAISNGEFCLHPNPVKK